MRRLLLVDDNESVLITLSTWLTQCGYEVVTARDGMQALTSIEMARVDAAIVDIHMPVIDGITLCRMLKRWPGLAGMPVWLMTGALTRELEHSAMAAGAFAVLRKPFRLPELEAMLAQHFGAAVPAV